MTGLLKQFAHEVVILTFFHLLRMLPMTFASRIGEIIFGTIALFRLRHKRSQYNLRAAFPYASSAVRNSILVDSWKSFGRSLFEWPHLKGRRSSNFRIRAVDFEGKQVDGGEFETGDVLFSTHSSNWELLPQVVNEYLDRALILYKPTEIAFFDRMFRHSNTMGHVEFLRTNSRVELRRLARQSPHTVTCLLLRLGGPSGYPISLFGKDTFIAKGVINLALNGSGRIWPAAIYRESCGVYVVKLQKPIVANEMKSPRVLADAIAASLEAIIEERPGEWMWFGKMFPAG